MFRNVIDLESCIINRITQAINVLTSDRPADVVLITPTITDREREAINSALSYISSGDEEELTNILFVMCRVLDEDSMIYLCNKIINYRHNKHGLGEKEVTSMDYYLYKEQMPIYKLLY